MADSTLSIILALKDEASAKLKQFNSNIADFKDKSHSALDSAKRGLSAIRTPALIASAAITGVVTAGFKLAESAGKYESIRDAFGQMTEGMGVGVEDFEKKVADASAGTLDKLTILQGGTRALSLMGKEAFSDFGNDFAKMAEYAKKASRATGYEVTYMFDSLITGMSRESKMILDNLGITVDLVKAKEEYAATLGKEASELTAVEEKQAVLNHTLTKLEEVYGNVSVSSGGMAGAMSKLKTTITDAKLEIGLALIPVFNDLVRTLTPIIKEHVPKLIEKIKSIISWFQNLSPTAQKIIMLLLALAPAIVMVSTVLMPVITVIQALIPLFVGLAGVIGGITAPVWVAIAAIGALVAAGIWLYKNWNEVKIFFRDTWEGIKIIFREAIDAVMQKLQPLINVIETVKRGISSITAKIPEIKMPTFSLPSWLHFQKGGIVPGPIGKPIPAIVHSGETIIPTGKQLGTINVYVQGGNYLDREAGEKFAEYLGAKLRRELRF